MAVLVQMNPGANFLWQQWHILAHLPKEKLPRNAGYLYSLLELKSGMMQGASVLLQIKGTMRNQMRIYLRTMPGPAVV